MASGGHNSAVEHSHVSSDDEVPGSNLDLQPTVAAEDLESYKEKAIDSGSEPPPVPEETTG